MRQEGLEEQEYNHSSGIHMLFESMHRMPWSHRGVGLIPSYETITVAFVGGWRNDA